MTEVKAERTGWRDLELSERHREWGWDCPAIDIDFLLVEYDRGKAMALVEYKHEYAQPVDISGASYRALIDLGDRANVPVFICRYAADFTWWRAMPINPKARETLPQQQEMTEEEWVRFLYRLRGYEIPPDVLNRLIKK